MYRKISTKVQSPHIPPIVPHSFSYDLHCILFGTFVTGYVLDNLVTSIDTGIDANIDSSLVLTKAQMLESITIISFLIASVLFYVLAYWRLKKIQIL